MRTYVRRKYGYTLIEYDPEKPWLILRTERLTISLLDDQGFFDWSAAEWPAERYTVALDPWGLPHDSPDRSS